jgi:23S rRNA (cytidine1920-2'-O)/16S rRNA (cytidine1409-2'-O)-methyltransferase
LDGNFRFAPAIIMTQKKKRLDLTIIDQGLVQSRQRARAVIMAGKVFVDDVPVDKPGVMVSHAQKVILKGEDIPYVGRGGVKLEEAIQKIGVVVEGLFCLDVGAATGGFTDCLLQHGAAHVFAVDVGYGQFAWKLRQDERVTVIERTNIRYMPPDALPCAVDLVTIDVSFISLKIVVPAVMKFMTEKAGILALIKPQFEVGKGQLGKGGVVRDSAMHESVINDLTSFFEEIGLDAVAVVASPILGPKGNQEFIIYLKARDADPNMS